MTSIYRYLDTVGDGSGIKTGIAEHATPTPLKIVPAAGQVIEIERMIIFIRDTAIDSNAYGATAAGALSNGILVRCFRGDDVILDLLDGVPILTTGDWVRQCFDADTKDWAAAGNKLLTIRWQFRGAGSPLQFHGDHNDSFQVLMDDDMRHLVDHRFMVQGRVVA